MRKHAERKVLTGGKAKYIDSAVFFFAVRKLRELPEKCGQMSEFDINAQANAYRNDLQKNCGKDAPEPFCGRAIAA